MKELISEYDKLVLEKKKEQLKRAKVILFTCSTSGSQYLIELLKDRVKQLIIDEAAMCTEADSLVPIVNYEPERIILVGDHQQLLPIITCQAAKSYGLQQSLFNRYTKLMPDKILMLTTQYRMHSDIAKFPSKMFYNDKLTSASSWQNEPTKTKIFNKSNRNIFCHINGEEKTNYISTPDAAEMSKSNSEEANVVAKVIEELKNKGIQSSAIGVLTPFRAQILEISSVFKSSKYSKERKYFENVNLRTIVSSQGSEWEYVILSCVRSYSKSTIDTKSLGSIGIPNNINVAITRAKQRLIIIGKRNIVFIIIKYLINYY